MDTSLKFLPPSICIRVTKRCNANCDFCQAPFDTKDEPRFGELQDFIRFFARKGVRSLKLSGGEPTLRHDLPDIVSSIYDYGMRPSIITNGVIIAPIVIDSMKRANGEIKISIHHYSEEKNNHVLGADYGARVLNNAEHIAMEGVMLSINTVLTPPFELDLRKMTSFAKDMGASKITFIPVIPRGRARDVNGYDIDLSTLEKVKEKINRVIEKEKDIMVKKIDLYKKQYWILEVNGNLYQESKCELEDKLMFTKAEMIGL